MSEMSDMVLLDAEEAMDKSLAALERELNQVRTGRANPSILDSIVVEYYGVPTPIKQMSSVSAPEANQLYIKPYDKSTLKEIEKAITASNLGLTPQNDGAGIRLVFPQMTEQRRKELCKDVAKMTETYKVQIRNARRDANDEIKKLELPEDEEKGCLEDVQALTDKKVAKAEEIGKAKEQELLTI